MVKYIKYIVIAAILAVAGIIVFYSCEKITPEKQIRKQLAKFILNASKSSGDKLTTGLIKSRSIEKLFAPRCKFDVGASLFSGTYTPTQISANSMRCRTMFRYVKFSVSDVQVNLTSPTAATMDFTGVLDGVTKRGESIKNYKELTCHLQLIEGKWLISALSIREIIKK